jgi:hypothetical protein
MNTTVTISYSNGATRKFVASDDLEVLINEGEMFSVSTMHSDMGINDEMSVSKMYAGNPVAALGHMMMMRRNAEKLLEKDESMNVVIETLNACIKFISDEVTSHQSGMIHEKHVSPAVKEFQQEALDRIEQDLEQVEVTCRVNGHLGHEQMCGNIICASNKCSAASDFECEHKQVK